MKKTHIRKPLSVLLSVLIVFSVFGGLTLPAAADETYCETVLFRDDFETDPADRGWTFVDADGDGENWEYEAFTSENWIPHSGDMYLSSFSWRGSALTPDNWAISPAIPVQAGAVLSFWVIGQNPNFYNEHYGVFIGETADIASMNALSGELVSTDLYEEKKFDLSTWAGKTVYIAVRHYNVTDVNVISFDDFVVTVPGETPHTYGETGDARFTCTNCGYVNQTLQAAYTCELGHHYGTEGASRYTCALCGQVSFALKRSYFCCTEAFADNFSSVWGWKFVDGDGDGEGWFRATMDSEGVLASQSTGLTPDNWVISPAIDVPADAALTYKEYGYLSDHYGVYIGQTADTASMTPLSGELVADDDWDSYERSFDLSAWAGKTVYIAFRHYNSSDLGYAVIADVFVGSFTDTEHSFAAPEWYWWSDYSEASIAFTCTTCGYIYMETDDSPVETEFSAATCGEDRTIKYTATVTDRNGTTFTDEKTAAVPGTATGAHVYGVTGADRYVCTVCGKENAVEKERLFCRTVVFAEGFETDPAAKGWTFVDADGDGKNWERFNTESKAHAGTYTIRSTSASLSPDNWAISPAVAVPAGAELSFWVRGYSSSWPEEHYRVYIGETADIAAMTALSGEEVTTVEYEKKTYDLSAWAGRTVYVAIRHYNVMDEYNLLVDDFRVEVFGAEEHAYADPVWTWASDYSSAAAQFTCTACGYTYTQTDNAPVETELTAASCSTDRVIKYTAAVTDVSGATFTDETGVITLAGTATGEHVYGETGADRYTCTVCGKTDELLKASIVCCREVYFCDFEKNSPGSLGWRLSDNDSDRVGWGIQSEGSFGSNKYLLSAPKTMFSDNTAVTPAITVPADGMLTFNLYGQNGGQYCVYVGETYRTSEMTELSGEQTITWADADVLFYPQAYDLSAWAGKTVYIAFRQFNSKYVVGIDDVRVTSVAEHEYGETGDARFTCIHCGYVDVSLKSLYICKTAFLTEDFETDLASKGWTFVDADGDGKNWERFKTESKAHSGTYTIRSTSDSRSPDNWVISPAVAVPAGAELSFWVRGYASSWPEEHYRVYIGETADIAAMTALSGEEITTVEYEKKTYDLSAWAGKTVYIAVRHYNVTDEYNLLLDDFCVMGFGAEEHAFESPVWTWASDYSAATAAFRCSKCQKTFTEKDSSPTFVDVSAATCTENQTRQYAAGVSFRGVSYTTQTAAVEVPGTATDHNWGVWTKLNDTQHKRVCGNDASHVQTEDHKWNAGVVTTPATCTADGVKTYTCTACSATKTEKIAAKTHSWGAWTKLDDTQHKRVCGNDASHVQTEDHKWNAGVVTTPATCTADGVKTYTCTVCSATKTEIIAAKTHSWGAWTKLNDTQHKRVCGNDASHVQTEDHKWNAGVVTKAANCKETGVKTYTCTVCGATKTETIAKTTNHTWDGGKVTKAATCKEAGVKTFTCTACSATKTETIAKTTNHTWNGGKVTKAATCKEAGVKTYTCTVCGATKTETIAKTTNHTWNGGKVTKAATCKEAGVKTYTCTVCSATKTETIAKTTNHTWDGGKVTKAATETAEGVKTFTCTVCGATKTEGIPKLTPEKPDTLLPGDVDGDQKLSAADARYALRAAVGLDDTKEGLDFSKKTNRCFVAADVTKDGKILAEDARLILRAAVGLETLS